MKSFQTINQKIEQHQQSELSNINEQTNFNQDNKNQAQGIWQLLNNVIKTTRDLLIKDVFSVDDSEIVLNAGQKFKRTSLNTLITGAIYSVTRSDYLIGITNLSYAPTIGLPIPSIAGIGKNYVIKDETGEAASTTITICSYDDYTIDGAANTTIATNYGIKSFYTNGNQWFAGPS